MKISDFIDFFPPNSVNWMDLSSNQRTRLLSRRIQSIADSSNQVKDGSIFFAIKGNSVDGHKFVNEAIAKGAVLIVIQDAKFVKNKNRIPTILVKDTRLHYEKMCSLFFGRKDEHLFNVGVTGTNGKTSTTYLIEYMLQNHGIKTGVIGTVNHRVGDKIWPTNHTTPDPWTVHKRFSDFHKVGARASAVEITSHGLDQKRMRSVSFDVGIFTNLTQDHLDYHGTMTNYFLAKEKFFVDSLGRSNKAEKYALVNGDDSYGKKLKMAFGVTKYFFGQDKTFPIWFEIKEKSFEYQWIKIGYFNKHYSVKLPLLGMHNVYNFMPCIFICDLLKIPLSSVFKKMELFAGIPGRLQRVKEIKKKHVFIDFAHTPDGMAKTIDAIRSLRGELKSKGKIITVFGCGGDRDKLKRPLMARTAEAKSEIVILTSDNPRSENPLSIIDDIKKGFKNKKDKFFESNRSLAIKKAMELSKDGDTVLILGKGHETFQIIGDKKFPFNDYTEVIKHA